MKEGKSVMQRDNNEPDPDTEFLLMADLQDMT
jgi:hypothetical protein